MHETTMESTSFEQKKQRKKKREEHKKGFSSPKKANLRINENMSSAKRNMRFYNKINNFFL